ncbi:sterol 26-hydroxylase, mitochondrial-like [Lethenteron reissneri]|uniref:sterol 26-hydroxylase, mitochondrial-like n=1 Tax=Lethenteron reissneri TaxID=7753 RepID=UPI002AB64853|nr:sterol 26-hydroxylase, mitochondrial-like [Lethenteron reissneri]
MMMMLLLAPRALVRWAALPQRLPLTVPRAGLRSPQAALCSRGAVSRSASGSSVADATARRGADDGKLAGKLDSQTGQQPRSVKELPGVGMLSSLYWLVIRGYLSEFHELQIIHHKRFGNMWTTYMGPELFVCLADPDLIEQLMRQEGPYPVRSSIPAWDDYHMMRGHSKGLLTQTGADWKRMREVLNQRMLKPKEVMQFADPLNAVVTELMGHVRARRGHGAAAAVFPLPDVAQLLYRFAFEGVTTVLFETRMGSLEETVPKETQDFIRAIESLLSTTMYVLALPRWTRPLLPFWGRFVQAWDVIINTATRLINVKLAEVKDCISRGQEVRGEYLTYLLASGRLSLPEIYSNTTEILLAGVDTTSNTLSWSLYHLARMPALQEALCREVNAVVPGDAVPGIDEVARMPLLKAVIKETLRLYPVVFQNGRYIMDDGLVVGGYSLPKGTHLSLCHYVLSMDGEIFPNPREFRPQRWLRGKDRAAWRHGSGGEEEEEAAAAATSERTHPFAYIPFGFGLRGCVGRRIAELEMHLCLARFVKTFEMMPEPGAKQVLPKTRGLLVPSAPINLLLRERL